MFVIFVRRDNNFKLIFEQILIVYDVTFLEISMAFPKQLLVLVCRVTQYL